MPRNRLRFVASLIAVTIGAGLFAVAFRVSLAWMYGALYGHDNVVDSIGSLPWTLRAIPPILGATVAGSVARLRMTPSQGVSNVMEAIALGNVHLSLRTTVTRIISSWMAIAGGMSIGREGPLIEVGGALGAGIGRAAGVSLRQTRVLVAAGTAAGFAAAYNTPFAAAFFVVESIAGVAAPELILPVMAGAAGAAVMMRMIVGGGPIYGERTFVLASNRELLFVAILGVAAAILTMAFKRVLGLFEQWSDRHPLPQPMRALLGGALVGVIAMALPSVVGNGYEVINHILDAPVGAAALLVLIGAKVVATSGSVASGIPGGIFTPMLMVGAALGAFWAHLIAGASVGSYALVGMAATAAASIHAPLTAAVMVFELSGDYGIVLPLVLVTVVSTSVSRALGTQSVYETELRKRGLGWEVTLEGRRVHPPAAG